MTPAKNRFHVKWSRLIASAICPTYGLELANNAMDCVLTAPKGVDRAFEAEALMRTIKRAALRLNPSISERGIKE